MADEIKTTEEPQGNPQDEPKVSVDELQQKIEKLEKEKQLLAEAIAGEGFTDKEIASIDIVVKEKEKPSWILLGRGGKLRIPSFILDGCGNKWMIRVANTDPSKLRGWLMEGYSKCTYKEIGLADKDLFPGDPARGIKGAPNGVARIGEDMIVLKIREYLWKQHMEDKKLKKRHSLKGMLHAAADGINKDGRDKYHLNKDIAIGASLNHKNIENM